MQLRLGLSLALSLTLSLACGDSGTDPDAGVDTGSRPDLGFADTGTDGGVDSGLDSGVADGAVDSGVDAGADAGPTDTGAGPNPDCDSIMPEVCSLPWPSDKYLVEDNQKASGYALTFGATSLPQNSASPPSHIQAEPWNRLDGYGVGSPVIVLFPNLDGSSLPGEDNIGASLDANAKVLLYRVNGKGLERVPYFVDFDIYTTDYDNPNPAPIDPAERVLFVRPAVVLDYATRYIVAFRDLETEGGAAIAPSPDFARLVAGDTSGSPELAARQDRFDGVFDLLAGEGIDKNSLTLAWSFVTGSKNGIHGRMLHMRDEAFTTVGAMGPEITITSTQALMPGDADYAEIAYEIEGTIRVPNYLTDWFLIAARHTVLNYGPDDLPEPDGWRDAKFWARIPRSALSSTVTVGLLQHGHGQLGSGRQIRSVRSARYHQFANRYHYILFACDLIGMSEAEELPLGISLGDFSGFRWIGDTLHQGMLDSVLLARAFKNRFANDAWVQSLNLSIDSDDLRYFGISQGGIFGASFLALSPDINRGHLGVGGANYGTILQRSRNFTVFFEMLAPNYPRKADQAIILALAQLLFDGTESISYVRHLEDDPFPGQGPSHALFAFSKGDYQVSPMTNSIVSRTNIGLPIMENFAAEGAPYGVTPASYPRTGSGMVLYDFGNPWPPVGNRYFNDGLDSDPHSYPRRLREHNDQMVNFFRTGEIIDVCGGTYCQFSPQ